MDASPYQRLGGCSGLEAIIDDFIDRVTGDMMIGFFFKGVDKEKLKQLEVEFASSHLGGPTNYSGRPLPVAHGPHRIMGGQFNRRLRLLEKTLRDHEVDEDIIAHWLEHNERLRAQITRDTADECQAADQSARSTEQKTDGAEDR